MVKQINSDRRKRGRRVQLHQFLVVAAPRFACLFFRHPGIARALLLENRHGDLGQEVERDDVELATLQLATQDGQVVPPVAARVADANEI